MLMGYLNELIQRAKQAEQDSSNKQEKKKKKKDILEGKQKILIDEYGDVKIYRVSGEPLLYYTVPVPRPTGTERRVINLLKEATARLVSISTAQFRDPEARRNFYKQKVLEIIDTVPELGIPRTRREFYADAVVREIVGYGIIDPLVRDDQLEEIMVIGPEKPVYVFHRKYGMMKTNVVFYSDQEIRDLIDKIAREVGRHIDAQSPLLDARLPDGSRVNATIPPASVDGSTITIRKFRKNPYTIIDLIDFGTFTPEVAAFLWLAVDGFGARPANILIAGGTGSGKTTTLNVLATFIPAHERIITIEDTAELNLPLEHWVRLEARPPGLEGTGEITMDILVKNALRMRPDRIIVGEVRHKEAYTLFTAMNTGHDGCMGTIHSNSAEETMVRITSPPMEVPEIMATALDFIIVQHRIHDRRKGTIRRVTEIAEVRKVDNKPKVVDLYVWDAKSDTLLAINENVAYLRELSEFTGLSVDALRDEIGRRTYFLQRLREEGIRDLKRLKAYIQRYYEEASKIWKK